MVYLKAILWNLKMCAATVFEKRARQPTLENYFKEKETCGMKCELVNEKSVIVQVKV
jgi:hypothetical protein